MASVHEELGASAILDVHGCAAEFELELVARQGVADERSGLGSGARALPGEAKARCGRYVLHAATETPETVSTAEERDLADAPRLSGAPGDHERRERAGLAASHR